MNFRSKLLCNMIMAIILMLWPQSTAQVLKNEVERKAQRSPSLRLRFGRSSDPQFLTQNQDKRWFDEVNQKPIRSPSLRLRFGRRSDPSMPLHSPYDMFMNDQTEENNVIYDANPNRVVREPPPRLRWGRCVTLQSSNINDLMDSGDELNDIAAASPSHLKWGHCLTLQSLKNAHINNFLNSDDEFMDDVAAASSPDDANFNRVVREPKRLRFGRSVPLQLFDKQNHDKDNDDDANHNRNFKEPPPGLGWKRCITFQLRWGYCLTLQSLNNGDDNIMLYSGDEIKNQVGLNFNNDFYNSLIYWKKLRNLLMSLKQDIANDMDADASWPTLSSEEDIDGFNRVIRKPGPLRLRWGRSTGGRKSLLDNDIENKKNNSDNTNNVDKTD